MSKSIFAIAFLSGGAIGAYAGFKLAERHLMTEFEEAVEHERTSIAAMYAARQPYASPQEAVEALVQFDDVVEAANNAPTKEPTAYYKIKPSTVEREEVPEEEKPEPIHEENIFEHAVEIPQIYVIPQLEFEHGDDKYQKIHATYYVEDKILASFDDEIFEKPEEVIGDCLERFGEQSNDPDVVYVRNEKVDIHYEVTRDPGSYWRSQHGVEPPGPLPSGREG